VGRTCSRTSAATCRPRRRHEFTHVMTHRSHRDYRTLGTSCNQPARPHEDPSATFPIPRKGSARSDQGGATKAIPVQLRHATAEQLDSHQGVRGSNPLSSTLYVQPSVQLFARQAPVRTLWVPRTLTRRGRGGGRGGRRRGGGRGRARPVADRGGERQRADPRGQQPALQRHAAHPGRGGRAVGRHDRSRGVAAGRGRLRRHPGRRPGPNLRHRLPRGRGPHARTDSGAGLGLAIARAITEAHGASSRS
jgi:hypothetical protein